MFNLWWWEHVSQLISIVLAGCLTLLSVVLLKWPPPKSTMRYVTAASGLLAAAVIFWSATISNLAPHPKIMTTMFIALLTYTMLKHRAGVVAKQNTSHRRTSD